MDNGNSKDDYKDEIVNDFLMEHIKIKMEPEDFLSEEQMDYHDSDSPLYIDEKEIISIPPSPPSDSTSTLSAFSTPNRSTGSSQYEEAMNTDSADTHSPEVKDESYDPSIPRKMFPEFPSCKKGNHLRFTKLFDSNPSVPQLWKSVQKRRLKNEGVNYKPREKRGWAFRYGPEPDDCECVEDDEKLLCQREPVQNDEDHTDAEQNDVCEEPQIWREGPAKLWYDMLNVPDDAKYFHYGLKLKRKQKEIYPKKQEDQFPDEAFHMVTQLNWESNILWDRNQCDKYQNRKESKVYGCVCSFNTQSTQYYPHIGGNNSSVQVPYLFSDNSESPGSTTLSPLSNSTPPTRKRPKPRRAGKASLGRQQEDPIFYSIFESETTELACTSWEDDIIWNCDQMEKLPQPKILTLDPNDENTVLYVPDDPGQSNCVVSIKTKVPNPHIKKSKAILGNAGVIDVIPEDDCPPCSPTFDSDRDPYNISNDEYYFPRIPQDSILKINALGDFKHSIPGVQLQASLYPTNIIAMKKDYHRPTLKKFNYNRKVTVRSIHPLNKHMYGKQKEREDAMFAAGGGDIFLMKTPEDLSGKDGELILVEYCEEFPPVLSQVGMCSKIINYYKRKTEADASTQEMKYGELFNASTSPFLGVLRPGQLIQTLENKLYRAPLYEHRVPANDFLILRRDNKYYIRQVDGIFTAGQQCPLYEVPNPKSKRSINFLKDFLLVFIYRLFWRSQDNPRRIRMEDVKKAFPTQNECSIRKRLKKCADFVRTGENSNWWVLKSDFRLPTDEEIQELVSPEQYCAYFSSIAAEERLNSAGYAAKCIFTPEADERDESGNIEDEVIAAPWNTTRSYLMVMKGKGKLQLHGPADPTGCGEGFSYVRIPRIPARKEDQETPPRPIVTGTDADLRKLSLRKAKALLSEFGLREESMKKLARWEVIDLVRTLSTEKAKTNGVDNYKFSRRYSHSVAEYDEKYKADCQLLFDRQNEVLQSEQLLSSDDSEAEEEHSDTEEMGRTLENLLKDKKTILRLNHEDEEWERRELQKMISGNGKECADKDECKNSDENAKPSRESGSFRRILKIHRNFKSSDGTAYTATEIVTELAIIDTYIRIRNTKDDEFIRKLLHIGDDAKEELKKEKRRIQDKLRRLKNSYNRAMRKPKPKKVRVRPVINLKCGACGQVGHMKTNKDCPLYVCPGTSPRFCHFLAR